MRSLAALIKLQKTRVDEQRIVLAHLQNRLDDILNEIEQHKIRQLHEQKIARENPETSVTYGAFLKKSVKHMRELEKLRLSAAKAVDLARERLAELFEEQKRYELAEQDRLEKERREQLRIETITLDEIGSITHERKKRRNKRR